MNDTVTFSRFDELGRYTEVCVGSEESLAHEIEAMVYLGSVDPRSQYHDFTTDLPVDMPEKPTKHHVFNYVTKAWDDPRSLDELKAQKWTEIKSAREATEFGGFSHAGNVYDSGPASITHISGAVQLAMIANSLGQSFSNDWTLMDNTVVTLNASQMIAVGVALGMHVNAQFEKARLLRLEIEAATTAEAVAALVW